MFSRLIPLILKELQIIMGNTQGRLFLIVPVIMQVLIFPFSATLEVKNSSVLIYNQDKGSISKEIVQRIAHASSFSKQVYVNNDADLVKKIENQDALIGVIIPNNFSANVLRNGGDPSIQAIVDGRRSNSAQVALSYVETIIDNYMAEIKPSKHSAEISVRNLYNPNLDYELHIVPCLLGIISTVSCLMVSALSVSREREEGTFDQVLISPLTPFYIMIGKAVPGILIAIFQGTIIIAAAVFFYHIPLTGSLFTLYLGMFLYGLSLVGFGLFISSLCSTQQQAFLGVFCFMVPAVILSGYVSPVENMPLVFRVIAAINPLTHFIVISKGVFLKNFGLMTAAPQMWPMLAVALITMFISYRMFRKHIA